MQKIDEDEKEAVEKSELRNAVRCERVCMVVYM